MIIRSKKLTAALNILKVLLVGVYGRYLFLYVAAILSTFLEIIGISLVFPLIFYTLGSTDVKELPWPITNLLRLLHLEGNIIPLGIFLVAIFFGKAFFMFLVQYGNARITHEIRARWMKRLFEQYITSNLQFFIKTPQGQLLYNLYDLTQQCLYGVRQLISLFAYGISSVVIISILMVISWQITLVTAGVLVFVYLGINRPLMSRAHALGKASYKQQQKVNAFPNEAFRGIREIKTYSMQTMIINSYRELVDRMTWLNQKIQYYQLLPPLLPEVLIVTMLTVAIIILNGMPNLNLPLMLSFIATYTYALFRLFLNGSVLVQSMIMINTIWPVMEHLTEMLVSEKEREVPSGSVVAAFRGDALICRDVSYTYDGKTCVINNVSVSFQLGHLTAIIGGSGAGKSTLADLLLRMISPSAGEICYGSDNIASYQIDSWRGLIGFVSQDTFLFHGTIRDNIAFGSSGATDLDITRATKQAGAHEFIKALPDGYLSIVGERGAKLSGGQRQRIAIARALVRQPKILILDEATSALDAHSEASLKETLVSIKNNMIVIFISHRLASVADADNILVMKNGQVAEQGSHKDLLARQGEYWRLCQFYH